MRLEEYVSQLLYRYQCVIIPGFGAFLTEIKPARLNEEANTFYPPYKAISYNPHLINNDGLLANTIAIVEKISFDEATKVIENTIVDWNQTIQYSGTFSLEDIGSFTKNTEGSLVFEPYLLTNYLAESFGLTAFVSPKVKRDISKAPEKIKVVEPVIVVHPTVEVVEETPVETVPLLLAEKEPVDTPVVEISNPEPVKTTAKEATHRIIVQGVLETLNAPVVAKTSTKVVTIQKPKISSLIKYAAAVLVGTFILGAGGIKIHNNNVVVQTANMASAVTNEVNRKISQETFILNPPEGIALPLPIKIEQAPFHVVASAFKNLSNAKNEMEILEIAGFESKMLPKNERGMYTVIYASYSSKNEANEFLTRIKKYYNPEAWLLVKDL